MSIPNTIMRAVSLIPAAFTPGKTFFGELLGDAWGEFAYLRSLASRLGSGEISHVCGGRPIRMPPGSAVGVPLPSRFFPTVQLELVNHAIEIRIASAKFTCEPVATPFDNSLAIGDHVELTDFARRRDGFNVQSVLD